jgi:hypothetical protein
MHLHRKGRGFFEDVAGLFGGKLHKKIGNGIAEDLIGGISSIFGGQMPNGRINKDKFSIDQIKRGGKLKPLSYKLK